MLQQGFGRSSAQNHGLGGDVRLKCGEHLLLFLLLCRSTENGDLAWTAKALKKYIATREIPTCRRAGSALCTMCYVDVHAAIMVSTCTELAWGPWVTGGA